MKPIDYRNESFVQVQARVEGLRAAVYGAWRTHGPCTTKELAARSGLELLTIRPRTTELYQLGYVVLVESEHTAEGTYRAATSSEIFEHFQREQSAVRQPQGLLPLGA